MGCVVAAVRQSPRRRRIAGGTRLFLTKTKACIKRKTYAPVLPSTYDAPSLPPRLCACARALGGARRDAPPRGHERVHVSVRASHGDPPRRQNLRVERERHRGRPRPPVFVARARVALEKRVVEPAAAPEPRARALERQARHEQHVQRAVRRVRLEVRAGRAVRCPIRGLEDGWSAAPGPPASGSAGNAWTGARGDPRPGPARPRRARTPPRAGARARRRGARRCPPRGAERSARTGRGGAVGPWRTWLRAASGSKHESCARRWVAMAALCDAISSDVRALRAALTSARVVFLRAVSAGSSSAAVDMDAEARGLRPKGAQRAKAVGRRRVGLAWGDETTAKARNSVTARSIRSYACLRRAVRDATCGAAESATTAGLNVALARSTIPGTVRVRPFSRCRARQS